MLGRYRIVKEIGRGAMGVVYLAHDPKIDRKVAIKTVRFFDAVPRDEGDESRQRFMREARAAGRLMHPGIVTIFDVGETDGLLYLAMEYVEGATLDVFCKPDNLLPVKTVVEMVAGTAEALAVAHAAGIVHRDIKPANLMRVGDTSCKVMDFGLARPSEGQLTQDGALMGTPSYMAPEQIRGGAVDQRSDLFSLGVVLFEMITGERPFAGDSISSIIYRIVHEEPPEASAVNARAQPALNAFLQQALAKNPESRFSDGAAFAEALRRATSGVDQPPAPPPVEPTPEVELPPPSPAPPKSSAAPYVVTALVLILLGGGAAYYFRDQLGLAHFFEPAEVFWETRVVTEPPGLPLQLDGVALSPDLAGLVRFRPEGPFGLVSASHGCREAEHRIDAADAGGEVVLVLEPVRVKWTLDPGVAAAVELNGEKIGSAPLELDLDLCRDNQLKLSAFGYRPETLEIPSGSLPMDTRTRLGGLTLVEIPRGTLTIPRSTLNLVHYLDGKRIKSSDGPFELLEGEHELRLKNSTYWIDVRRKIRITGGETVVADVRTPELTTLVVLAVPSNCKVFLRKPGGEWKYVDDTPARRRLAVGSYELRVKLNPTGQTKDQSIELVAGENPAFRVSFGRDR